MLRLLLKQNSTFDKTTRGKKGIEERVVGRYLKRTRALKKFPSLMLSDVPKLIDER